MFKSSIIALGKGLAIAVVLFIGYSTWAHGENVFGPNGGYVRMPGAFHTEIVPQDESHFKLFLLDIKWENPSNKGSKLEVAIRKTDGLFPVSCEIKTHFYVCELPKNIKLIEGQIEVLAEREGLKGRQVIYKLPLKLEK